MSETVPAAKKALRYAKRLIKFESPSHLSNRYIAKYLEMKLSKHGFVVERLSYRDAKNKRKVSLVAKKGMGVGGLAYFGHTDTVPATKWFTKKVTPFQPVTSRNRLYGRGACDMKGSIGCILDAAQTVNWEQLEKPVYIVLTADEEVGFLGATQVVEESKFYREMVHGNVVGIIGEPTNLNVVHAHKGSYLIKFRTKGNAGHSSCRDNKNAVWQMIPMLSELHQIREETEMVVDWLDENFNPPTMCANISVNDGNGVPNITSARCDVILYLRPTPQVDIAPIISRIAAVAKKHEIEVDMNRNCEPVWTDPACDLVKQSLAFCGKDSAQTVSYATDAGVLSEIEQKVILGPGSIAQAHTAKEWVAIDQLNRAVGIYRDLIHHYCGSVDLRKSQVR